MTDTDPRPAATEAAILKVLDDELQFYGDFAATPESVIAALQDAGYTIVPAAAAPPSGRAACSTCGEAGVDHDGFACRDCDGQGSTPIAAPPSGQVCVSAEDAEKSLESVNYHAAMMAKSAGKWRRKRPPEEDMAEGCDRRFSELEQLYFRIHAALKGAAT